MAFEIQAQIYTNGLFKRKKTQSQGCPIPNKINKTRSGSNTSWDLLIEKTKEKSKEPEYLVPCERGDFK